jgi:integrase
LLKELPEHLADMAAFTLATGLRQRNVSYLRWDQVDMARQMAWIHADQSKSRRAISVPLIEDAIAVLYRRSGRHPVYVFTYKDKPVGRAKTKAWKKALGRAGISDFCWHDLRHTWASWHVQKGTSLQELMELGGWSSFEMVLRYAHLAGDHLKEAAGHIEGTVLAHSNEKRRLSLIVSN